MESIVKGKQEEIQLPEELLTSFARFLVPEICKFYQSEEGRAYYEAWLKKAPRVRRLNPIRKQSAKAGCFPYI